MKTRRTVKMLTLGLMVALMLSPMLLVSAEPGADPEQVEGRRFLALRARNMKALKARPSGLALPYGYQNGSQVNAEPADIESELEAIPDEDVDELIKEIEDLPEKEAQEAKPFWVVWTKGTSWKSNDVVDAAEPDGEPIKMRLLLKPVKHTERGTLYKVVKGVIWQRGEHHPVEGVAVLKADHIFALKLEGEDIEVKAVGRIWKFHAFYRVAMKGRMNLEGENWSFYMKGRAFRIRLAWGNMPQVPRRGPPIKPEIEIIPDSSG